VSLPLLPEDAPDSITPLDAAAASLLPLEPQVASPAAVEPASHPASESAPAAAAEAAASHQQSLVAERYAERTGAEASTEDHAPGEPAAHPGSGQPVRDLDAEAPQAPEPAEHAHQGGGTPGTDTPAHDAVGLPPLAAAAVAHLDAPHAGADTPRVDLRTRWQGWWDEFLAWVRVFTSAAVYATLIVTFLFQVARVDGQSMAPTLEDRDRLIVNKLTYRLGEPQRGDIVMLYYPLDPDKSYVKRVIAEEGDMVRVVDGQVFVNDVPLPDDQIPPEYRSHDEWGPQVVPEGYYFVMGDHRNNSSDSRHWGFVPKKYIIGRVQLRWWPIPTATVF